MIKKNMHKRMSAAQEKDIAKKLNNFKAETVKGSGNTRWDKGDIYSKSLGLLVEAKFTLKPKITLKKEVLSKLHSQSLGAGYIIEVLAMSINKKEISLISTKLVKIESLILKSPALPNGYLKDNNKSFELDSMVFPILNTMHRVKIGEKYYGILPTFMLSSLLSITQNKEQPLG